MSVKAYGAYDGINVLPQITGESVPEPRTLFWRLQGQAAVLNGSDKLIRLSHRRAQMFQPSGDAAESVDHFDTDPARTDELFQMLGLWESSLATVPLWGSSPYWIGQSAKHYDMWHVRPEPK